ncbi:MAG: hypothetical protein PVJ53_09315 [Desulfobacterales bacterium]
MFAFAACALMACTTFKPKVEPVGAKSKPPPRKIVLPSVNYLGIPCYLHEVRWPEESLSVIARWYTGSEDKADILHKITPNLRADDLRPGDVIFIPKELSRRTEPMSRQYARRYGVASVPHNRRRPKDTSPEEDEAPEKSPPPAPYGPRTYAD